MKQPNQNEIDILLRSLARRTTGPSSAASGPEGASAEHLDADELNAFAEGMVTDRARARYSAHLADCDNCRSVVVSLTQSAGMATSLPAKKEDRSTVSFWQQLTGFFSHPALRFVVPAVVLMTIVGIAIVALRQDRPAEFVAQHQPEHAPNLDPVNQAAPSQSTQPLESTGSPPPAAPGTTGAVAPTPPTRAADRAAGTAAIDEAAEGPTTLRKETVAKSSEPAPTFAPDVVASAPPPSVPAYSETQRGQTLARDDAFKRESEARKKAIANTQAADSSLANNDAVAAKPGSGQTQQRNVQGLMREGRAQEDKDKSDRNDSAETTTISGRRFTRKNNSWVDTAYQPSRATTNVKRGSEQYRALIADEPGLRTFADQLGGEVIVVWKGRAYRFY